MKLGSCWLLLFFVFFGGGGGGSAKPILELFWRAKPLKNTGEGGPLLGFPQKSATMTTLADNQFYQGMLWMAAFAGVLRHVLFYAIFYMTLYVLYVFYSDNSRFFKVLFKGLSGKYSVKYSVFLWKKRII